MTESRVRGCAEIPHTPYRIQHFNAFTRIKDLAPARNPSKVPLSGPLRVPSDQGIGLLRWRLLHPIPWGHLGANSQLVILPTKACEPMLRGPS